MKRSGIKTAKKSCSTGCTTGKESTVSYQNGCQEIRQRIEQMRQQRMGLLLEIAAIDGGIRELTWVLGILENGLTDEATGGDLGSERDAEQCE